jgi:hypothetical protein
VNVKEAQAANRARLSLWPNGSSSTVDDRRYAYILRNHGEAKAFDIHVWLYDEHGNDLSTKPQKGFDLEPEESDDKHGVTVPLDVEPLQVRFGVNWHDGAGYHARPLHIPPTL